MPTTARRKSTYSTRPIRSFGPTSTSFPRLLLPLSEMPADLRSHTRYPETFFRVQAEVYRTYHMRDPWPSITRKICGTSRGLSRGKEKTHVLSRFRRPTWWRACPEKMKPEFLLITSFTPRSKDNMIGLMVARCDGDHLGELVVLQLSKQELIFGTMQIGARINQDQTISKDLSLWNQQGSQVLRGQTLVLPVGNTFLYVEPLYIQASEARMPQLKKVILAIGNSLIYRDTYEQALGDLSALMQGGVADAAKQPLAAAAVPTARDESVVDGLRESIRNHLHRSRELFSQGKWAEAGKELDAIEAEVRK